MPACCKQLPRKFPADAARCAKYEYRFMCHVSCSIHISMKPFSDFYWHNKTSELR